VKNPASWLLDGNWKNEPLPAEPLVSEKMALEEAVKVFIRTGRWSRHAPVSDISRAPAELLDKYGLLPDGRKKAA
jgi:hypothetical protein